MPDHPSMNTHFMVNLSTRRIHDKFKDERYPAPPEISGVLDEIAQFVQNEVRARKKTQEDIVERRKLEEIQREKEREHRVQVRLNL